MTPIYYRAMPISEKPDKEGSYSLVGLNGKFNNSNLYNPKEYGDKNGGWLIYNNPARVTHWLKTCDEEIDQLRKEIQSWKDENRFLVDEADKTIQQMKAENERLKGLIEKIAQNQQGVSTIGQIEQYLNSLANR